MQPPSMALAGMVRVNKQGPDIAVSGVADGEAEQFALVFDHPAATTAFDLRDQFGIRDATWRQAVFAHRVADAPEFGDIAANGLSEQVWHVGS